jgi:hypothetical protein
MKNISLKDHSQLKIVGFVWIGWLLWANLALQRHIFSSEASLLWLGFYLLWFSFLLCSAVILRIPCFASLICIGCSYSAHCSLRSHNRCAYSLRSYLLVTIRCAHCSYVHSLHSFSLRSLLYPPSTELLSLDCSCTLHVRSAHYLVCTHV